MATTTFKSQFLKLELNFEETEDPPTHSHQPIGPHRIKTNGSLFRSHSAEDGQMAMIAACSKLDDAEQISPHLKDVEALLNGYSEPFEEADEEDSSPPVLLSDCPEFQAYLNDGEGMAAEGLQNEADDDEIIYGFPLRDREMRSSLNEEVAKREEKDDEGAMWELIEAEAEALCKVEEDSKARHLVNANLTRNGTAENREYCSTLTRVSYLERIRIKTGFCV